MDNATLDIHGWPLKHLQEVKPNDFKDAAFFTCPCCGKRALARLANGRIILKCPGGCSEDQIIAAVKPPGLNGNGTQSLLNGGPPRSLPATVNAPPATARHHQAASPRPSSPTDDILRRVPPQDLAAEQSVLGAILIKNESIKEILELLGTDDFYREVHREIYRCMRALAQDATPIDPVTLSNALRTNGKFEAAGGLAYITELVAAVPAASNIAHYAEIVRGKALLRKVASKANEIASAAYDNPADVQKFLANVDEHFGKHVTAALAESQNGLTERQRADLPAVRKTQHLQIVREYLDEAKGRRSRKSFLEGLIFSGDTVALLGRAFAGKSTFACALTLAWTHGGTCLGRQCAKAKVVYLALERNGAKVASLFERWGLADLVFFTDSVPPMSPAELVAYLKAEIKAHGIEVLIIDHAQNLLRIDDTNSYSAVELALAPISQVARETGVVVLLLHHQGKTLPLDAGEIGVMGSEAWRGASDVLIEATKGEGNRHYIRADARGGTGLPRTLVTIDFETGAAEAIDAAELEARNALAAIKAYLATQVEPLDATTIREAVELKKVIVTAALKAGYDTGDFGRDGKGKKRDPFTYFLKAEMLVPPYTESLGPESAGSGQARGQNGLAENSEMPVPNPIGIGGTRIRKVQVDQLPQQEMLVPGYGTRNGETGLSGPESPSQNGTTLDGAGLAGLAGPESESQNRALANSDESLEPDIEFSEEKF